eukprot:TRINITY_DN64_c1_g1_i1.p1 TRINITY_DN64_c1_g1~~TRINITY_DN64_c1_g1_i1.p1  ORF type:complete len:264 (+),score=14.23 TRINITY_DN64_c1_g1_i1:74-865(+)
MSTSGMTKIDNKCKLAAWTIFYSIATSLSFSVLVGCGMWKHTMGITMGTLLFVISIPAICTSAYIITNRNPPMLSKTGGLLVGLPRCVTGYSYTEVTEASEMGSDTQVTKDETRSDSWMYYVRQLVAILMFLVVGVQFWARFSTKNPNWNSVNDVPACSNSSDNCVDRIIQVPGTPSNETLSHCVHSWISKTKRTHTIVGTQIFYHVRVLQLMFPFPDDVAISLMEGSSVGVHSASRLGSKDFGVNKKRVDNLEAYLLACVPQ